MIPVQVYSDEPIYAEGLRSALCASGFDVLPCIQAGDATGVPAADSDASLCLIVLHQQRVTAELVTDLRASFPDAKMVLCVDKPPMEMALDALELGIRGILSRKLMPDQLADALHMIAAGELYFQCPGMTGASPGAGRQALTAREAELLALVGRGMKNKEIARTMKITEGSVKTYLFRLFRRLGVKDRYELALYGMENAERPAAPGVPARTALPPEIAKRETYEACIA